MSLLVETGTWTGNNTSPQTITLANGSLTPVAIIAWGINLTTAAGTFGTDARFSMGFGTRRGGSTQSGAIGMYSQGGVGTSNSGRVRNTTLLATMVGSTSTSYTVSLSSFSAGSFIVTYSSAVTALNHVFHYIVFGGTDITDANVVNATMTSTAATQTVTGAGFQPDVMFCLDSDLATTGTGTALTMFSFGFASSNSRFQCLSSTISNADTMTSAMNNNHAFRSDACMERLTINADTSDARWDLDSFDSNGCTLGVVDAPTATDRVATFLFLKGGTWEAGSKAKATATGDDTFTLANSSLTPNGIMLFTTNQTAVGVGVGDSTFDIGAGTTPNATRASARNGTVGNVGQEFVSTIEYHLHTTDSVIEELGLSAPNAVETSEAWYDTASAGSFIIDWAVNGGSTALIAYLAFGDSAAVGGVAEGGLLGATKMIIGGIG